MDLNQLILAPDAFFHGTSTGHFINCNLKSIELTGYSREELLGMKMSDLFSDTTLNKVPLRFDLLKAGKNVVNVRELVAKDGKIIPIEMNSRQLPDGTMISFIRDISDRVEMNRKLERQNNRILKQNEILAKISTSKEIREGQFLLLARRLTEMISIELEIERVGIWIFIEEDTQLECIDLYRREQADHTSGMILEERLFSEEFEYLKSQNFIDANDPLTDIRTKAYVKAYILPLGITSMLDAVIRVGGRLLGVVCFEHVNKEHHWEADEIAFACQIADQIGITLLNEEFNQTATALMKSENRYRSLYNNSPVMLHSIDQEGKLLSVSDFWLSKMGYSRNEIIGRRSTDFLTSQSKDYAINEVLPRFFKEGKVENIEYQFVKKSGEVFDVIMSAIAEFDETGDQVRSLAVITDISDKVAIRRDLEIALERAQEAERLKSVFLSIMSHELRTPLNAIIGFSELIGEEADHQVIKSFAEIIHNNGNHLLTIIEGLFDISLMESQKLKLNCRPIQIRSIFEELYLVLLTEQNALSKHAIQMHLINPKLPNGWQFVSDESRLRQVIINLVKNALKFTETGEISFGYEFEGDQGKLFLKFFVRDTGIGIDPLQHKQIFEAFRQVDAGYNRKFGGAGLGLSVCKQLVELLGGEILLESAPGEGAKFFFSLALAQTA